MIETVKKTPRRSGRPKLSEAEKRKELRLFVSAKDASRLGALADVGGVSEGTILALLWRLVGEETWNQSLWHLCSEEIELDVAAGIDLSVHEGVAAGRVKIVSTSDGVMLSGASVRSWILR